jgi:hypothetical protein
MATWNESELYSKSVNIFGWSRHEYWLNREDNEMYFAGINGSCSDLYLTELIEFPVGTWDHKR